MYVRVVRRELASGHLRSINGGCHGRARVDWTGMMDSQSALQSLDMACHGWLAAQRRPAVWRGLRKIYYTLAIGIIHHHDHVHLATDCTQTRTAASRPNTAILPHRFEPVSWTHVLDPVDRMG